MGQTPRPVADLGSRRKTKRVHYELTRRGRGSDKCRRTSQQNFRQAWLADEIARRSRCRLTRASVNYPVSFLSSPCFESRMGGTPFTLFPRVILTPVFSGAYSGSATLFNPIHKIDRVAYYSPEIARR